MGVKPLGMSEPVVDETGKPLRNLNLFTEDVSRLPILFGSGSPNGIIEARATRLYMDTSGGSGSILYIKQVDDIAGDKSDGWILV